MSVQCLCPGQLLHQLCQGMHARLQAGLSVEQLLSRSTECMWSC